MIAEPISIGNLKLKNRIVRTATYEKMADEDGFVTDQLIGLYEEIAGGGSGLIITGSALVHLSGYLYPKQICIHTDNYVKGLKALTEAVHSKGVPIFIQLSHGGRLCSTLLLGDSSPLAPSSFFDPVLNWAPKELTNQEIWELVYAFATSARRARDAGFDGIQIQAANGYLLSSFLSPYTNKRQDYWGGDEERRFHFLEEVYRAIRAELGHNLPIIIKLNGDDLVAGGLRLAEATRFAQRLEYMGVDALEISGGLYGFLTAPKDGDVPPMEQEAYFKEHSRAIKSKVSIPVILTGGIRSSSVAQRLIEEGYADLVGLSRPLIREPDLPSKLLAGKQRADCISCNGCVDFEHLDYVTCQEVASKKVNFIS